MTPPSTFPSRRYREERNRRRRAGGPGGGGGGDATATGTSGTYTGGTYTGGTNTYTGGGGGVSGASGSRAFVGRAGGDAEGGGVYEGGGGVYEGYLDGAYDGAHEGTVTAGTRSSASTSGGGRHPHGEYNTFIHSGASASWWQSTDGEYTHTVRREGGEEERVFEKKGRSEGGGEDSESGRREDEDRSGRIQTVTMGRDRKKRKKRLKTSTRRGGPLSRCTYQVLCDEYSVGQLPRSRGSRASCLHCVLR